VQEGNVWTLELPRDILSFALEKDLRFDPAFLRHVTIVDEVLDRFKPDLVTPAYTMVSECSKAKIDLQRFQRRVRKPVQGRNKTLTC